MTVRLVRTPRRGALIALTPLLDVMVILLMFFMVTVSYLDLDVIPMVDHGTAPDQERAVAGSAAGCAGVERRSR
ncbi:hypothetical protein F1188_00730 [Roseospira marina]|uniref:Biopolymer transporter ExbD n=1 Tax=Roseospira marina TaxID=140057 RepID=A0A5M6IID3_9PROT|nr:hypothetical protein [Roseospira marina]KAA5607328.1 hypothetical protein F1188_00730 [Roseospira marina]MBB4312511.1 biopolymer transport protein ExbD [Roseospira marina]MBB5085473.1 biopolymer transport protein ExbD [Roseospira marina]